MIIGGCKRTTLDIKHASKFSSLSVTADRLTIPFDCSLLLIGFTIWGHAVLIQFGVSYVISTVAVLMPDFRQRQYAWSAITSLLFLLVQFILYNLASVLLVVRDPVSNSWYSGDLCMTLSHEFFCF